MVIDKDSPAEPPPYEPASSSSSNPLSTPPPIARCNWLNQEREHERIEGTYVVDPSLVVHESALAPPSKDEEGEGLRANLRLASTHARIDADVWVEASQRDAKQATRLMFHGTHALVDVRLVRSSPPSRNGVLMAGCSIALAARRPK